MIKRCCYCNKVYTGEEETPDGPPTGLWVVAGRMRENRVSHGICAACFETKISALGTLARRKAAAAGPAAAWKDTPASA